MDAVLFDEGSNPATVTKTGESEGVLAAGKHLKIETSPGGDEILDYEVPAGKVATVKVSLFIVETDI